MTRCEYASRHAVHLDPRRYHDSNRDEHRVAAERREGAGPSRRSSGRAPRARRSRPDTRSSTNSSPSSVATATRCRNSTTRVSTTWRLSAVRPAQLRRSPDRTTTRSPIQSTTTRSRPSPPGTTSVWNDAGSADLPLGAPAPQVERGNPGVGSARRRSRRRRARGPTRVLRCIARPRAPSAPHRSRGRGRAAADAGPSCPTRPAPCRSRRRPAGAAEHAVVVDRPPHGTGRGVERAEGTEPSPTSASLPASATDATSFVHRLLPLHRPIAPGERDDPTPSPDEDHATA